MEGAGDERRRVTELYRSYGDDPRKRHSWSAENPGNVAIREELVAAAFALAGDALRGAGRILDVGCGTGWWLEVLAERGDVGASLSGLDMLESRVVSARERVPGASIQVGDVRALPYDDGEFEAVTMFTVLSSLSGEADVRSALHEAWRVLTPGGVLLIWEPRVPNPFNRHTLLLDPSLVRDALPDAEIGVRTTTLLPPLARRLGTRTERLYPRLIRLAPLRTHRLIHVRATE